jgi:integrase
MTGANLSRKVVNARITGFADFSNGGLERALAIRRAESLQSVAPLKEGRSKARETDRVTPVRQDHIDAVLARLTEPVQAMIRLQLVTGMRPGEVVQMRSCDIESGAET